MTFWIGRTKVRLSFWFFLAVALFLLWEPSGTAALFFAAVVIHECGHLLVIRLLRLPVAELNLTPLEVGLRLGESARLTSGRQVALTLAGSLANLAAAGLLYLSGQLLCLRLSAVNLVLGAFHLLPLSGLDGGTALCLGLVRLLGPQYGMLLTRLIMFGVGLVGLAVCLWVLLHVGPSLSIILAAILFAWGMASPKTE